MTSNNELDIDKAYVSPYDIFMRTFDVKHAPSQSQLKEINKHQHLAKLRDVKQTEKNPNAIWKDF